MLGIIISICGILLFAIAFNYDTRRPVSAKLRYNFRIKDDSFLRKIIKLKDHGRYPCNYFKIIPIYLDLLLLIISAILALIDLLCKGIISKYISEIISIYVSLSLIVVHILYYVIITIWREIVDCNEMKFSREVKEAKKCAKKSKNEKSKNLK